MSDDDLLGTDGLLQEAVGMLQRLGEERSLLYQQVLLNLGRRELMLGRMAAAMKYLDESLALARGLAGPRDIAVAEVLSEQSSAFSWLENWPAAEQAAREAVDIYNILPPLHPDRVDAEEGLGEVFREQGKLAEATAIFNEVLSAYGKIYGENSRQVANILDSLARIAWAQQRLAESEELSREAVDRVIKAEGMDASRTARFRTVLARTQTERGKYAEAEAQCRAAIAVFEKTHPADHAERAAAEYFLGVALLATHRPKDAETYFRTTMSRSQRVGDPEWRVARAASGLGAALYAQGRAHEAEPHLVNSYRTVSANQHVDARTKAVVRDRLVRFYTERGQPDELQALTATSQQASP